MLANYSRVSYPEYRRDRRTLGCCVPKSPRRRVSLEFVATAGFRVSGHGAVTPMAFIDPHPPVCPTCGHDTAAEATCPTCGCNQREAR